MNLKPSPPILSREALKYILISAALYFSAILACFHIFHFVKGLDFRPATCIATAAGMLWGFPGAIGTAIGNAAVDVIKGADPVSILPSSAANFFLAYLPYRLWYSIDSADAFHFIFDRRTFGKYLMITAAAGTNAAMQICAFADVFYGLSLADFSIYIWAAQVIFPIALGIPIILFMRRRHVTCFYPRRCREGLRIPFSFPAVFALTCGCAAYMYLNGIRAIDFVRPYHAYALSLITAIYLSLIPCRYVPEREETINMTTEGSVTSNFLLIGTGYSVYMCFRTGSYVIGLYGGIGDEKFWLFIVREFFLSLVFISAGIYLVLSFMERNIFSRMSKLSRYAADFVRTGRIDEEDPELRDLEDSGRGDEIDKLTSAFRRLAHDIRRYIRDLSSAIKERETIQAQLDIAAGIQTGILPHSRLGCGAVEIAALMCPAKEVGGDLYDYFMIDETHVCIVIGDVSGKGVPAALFMSMAKMSIKAYAKLGVSPAEVFRMANDMLCESNEHMMFVTAWIGILDISSGELVYCNGGHNPIIAEHSGEFRLLKGRKSLALAVMEGQQYQDERLILSNGDMVLLYTDGVTEAHSMTNSLYGEERLLELLNKTDGMALSDIANTIKRSVDDYAGETEQFDDITILALRYKGADGNA